MIRKTKIPNQIQISNNKDTPYSNECDGLLVVGEKRRP